MAAILRIFDAIDGVRDYVVCNEQLIIGRDKSRVDICVRDMSVSRIHLKLFLEMLFITLKTLNQVVGLWSIIDLFKLINFHMEIIFN